MKYLIVLVLVLTSCKDGLVKEIPFVFEADKRFEIDNTILLR